MIDISILDPREGRYCMTAMIEEEASDAIFEEREMQGGGYTWEGVFRSILGLELPEALDVLEVGAEADNMYAYSKDRGMLEKAAELLRKAASNPEILLAAIEAAGDDIE